MASNRLRTLLFSVVPTTMLLIVCLALDGSALKAALAILGCAVLMIAVILRFRQKPLIVWLAQFALLLLLCFAAFYFTAQRDIGVSLGLSFIILCIFSENFFVQRQRRTALALFAIASAFGWLAVVELIMPPAFAVVGKEKSKYPQEVWQTQWKQDFYDKTDKLHGWKPRAETTVEATGLLAKDKEEWKVNYTTDKKGQRVVPGRPEQGPSILLLGGSFTFGHALKNEETIAVQLQQLRPENRVYNLAVNAYGTAQCLRRLEEADEPEITWVFYLSIDDHLDRNAGDARWMREYPTNPLLRLDESGSLVPCESVLAGCLGCVDRFLIGRSFIYDKLQTCRPWVKSDAAKVELTAAIIGQMNQVAQTKSKPSPRFVVAFVPQFNHPQESQRQSELIERVGEMSIASLNLRQQLDAYLEQHPDVTRRMLYDETSSHPTPFFSRLIAEWCNEYMRANSSN